MPQTSEQDVADALTSLVSSNDAGSTEEEAPAGDEAAEAVETEQSAQDADTVETVEETAPQGTSDDVDSLRQRLEQREAEVARYQEQLEAVRTRGSQSMEALNRRAMRFASERDKARQVLEKALSADGVDKAEAERLLSELRAGYNPQSANYQPPIQQPEPVTDADENALVVNQWLNDNGLTNAEADSLGAFIRTPGNLTGDLSEIRDPYRFLSKVAPLWRKSQEQATKPDDNVRAVQTVRRVQRQAAKAASAGAGMSGSKVGASPSKRQKKPLSDEQLTSLLQSEWMNR